MILTDLDPKMLGPSIEMDFAAGFYQSGDLAYTDPTQLPEATVKGPGLLAVTPDGALKIFPANAPRIVPGVGMLIEPGSSNLIPNMRNASPTSIAGWTRLNSRPVDSDITLADDSQRLYGATDPTSGVRIFGDLLDAGVMNGKVVNMYNPSSSTADLIVPVASVGPGQRVAFSAYVRVAFGQAQFTVTGGGGATPLLTGDNWRREGRVHTPTASGGQLRILVKPGTSLFIILAQLEESPQITSPIVTIGSVVSRAADELTINATHIFSRPHTFLGEVYMNRFDGVHRQIFSLSNGQREEIGLLRYLDNTLVSTMTRIYDDNRNRYSVPSESYWQPKIPNIYGPGRIVVGHRISVRGRAVGAGGVLAEDPFRPTPLGLSRMRIGISAKGDRPLNGWVRWFRVIDEIDDYPFEDAVQPGDGSMLIDVARYVSPNGDDAADGKTPSTAWKTLSRFAPVDGVSPIPQGTHVFLQRDGIWSETLLPFNRCTYRAYGSGAKPIVGRNQTYAFDENASHYFRIRELHLNGAKSRGVNNYGASGAQLVDVEASQCGSLTDDNAIAFALRGNSKKAEAELVSFPSTVNVTKYLTSESALTGVFIAKCVTAGSGAAMQWQVFRPDGSRITGTLVGGVEFSGGGLTLTLTGSASVGDQVKVRSKPFSEIAFPGNALCEDALVRLCYVHDNVGKAAGDAVYIEGIGGVCLVEGNLIPPPVGTQADCIQIGRNSNLYVVNGAMAIVRCNQVVAFTGGGKGAVVVRSERMLVECNVIRGHNFCIGAMARGIIRRNVCDTADLYPYSWGIGPGEDNDVVDQDIYENLIRNCHRGISCSGNGSSTFTYAGRVTRLQNRTDIKVRDNVVINALVGIFADRPISGVAYGNTFIDTGVLAQLNPGAFPPPVGGRYPDFAVTLNSMVSTTA